MKQFSSIVLPRDENPNDTLSLMSRTQGSGYSKEGYRRSLKDYEEPIEDTWGELGGYFL